MDTQDPFGGSGTTGVVAEELGRDAVLIELNPVYVELQKNRTAIRSVVAETQRPSPVPPSSRPPNGQGLLFD